MPRLNRYAWTQLAGGIIGLGVFLIYVRDAGWESAFERGLLTFVAFVGPLLSIQFLYDWRKYWKAGNQLDEMEKAISDKSRMVGFMADYAYFALVILAITFVYEHKGIEFFRVSYFRPILLGAMFVLLISQAVAIVVIYAKMSVEKRVKSSRELSSPTAGEQP